MAQATQSVANPELPISELESPSFAPQVLTLDLEDSNTSTVSTMYLVNSGKLVLFDYSAYFKIG